MSEQPDWTTTPAPAAHHDPGQVPLLVTVPITQIRAASQPAILVAGGCGGAGATTTALGLAAAIAAGSAHRSVAVDATVVGGDLGARGIDEQLVPVPLRTWLAHAPSLPAGEVGAHLSHASSGAGVLWRDGAPLPPRCSFGTAERVLRAAGFVAVFDGGAPVSGPQLRPLLADPAVRIVLTIPARVDAANRLRASLQWLDDEYGRATIAAATLVVSHQLSGGPVVAAGLRRHLRGWVRDVVEIPFDAHLATGLTIQHRALGEATRDAYTAALEGIWT